MPENRRQKNEREGGDFFERLAEHPAARRWILIGGIAGIALIFLSGLFTGGESAAENGAPETGQLVSAQEYAAGLQ